MIQGNANTSIKSDNPVTRLELTLENIECAELIAKLTEQNANLQRMLEIAHQEEKKSKKLLSAIRHFNSHAVRGSLTRIWGLSNVIKQTTTMEEVQKMANLLHKEASNLDEVIRAVNAKLNARSEAS